MTKKDKAVAFLQNATKGNIRNAYQLYVHPNFFHHNPFFNGDRQSLCVAMEENAKKFPTKKYEVVKVFEDGDYVIVHGRIKLQADFPEIAVVHMFRFDGELIIELWDVAQEVPKDMKNANGMF